MHYVLPTFHLRTSPRTYRVPGAQPGEPKAEQSRGGAPTTLRDVRDGPRGAEAPDLRAGRVQVQEARRPIVGTACTSQHISAGPRGSLRAG